MTPNPFTEPDISKRWMELHKAVIEHDVSGVNSAISSPNTSQQVKRTAIVLASYINDAKIVKTLIEAKVPPKLMKNMRKWQKCIFFSYF